MWIRHTQKLQSCIPNAMQVTRYDISCHETTMYTHAFAPSKRGWLAHNSSFKCSLLFQGVFFFFLTWQDLVSPIQSSRICRKYSALDASQSPLDDAAAEELIAAYGLTPELHTCRTPDGFMRELQFRGMHPTLA